VSFTPVRMPITDITRSIPAVVTVGFNHNMTTGQVVRLHVPKEFGMVELNQLLVSITILSATTFSLQYSQVPPAIPVDSRQFTPFVYHSVSHFTAEVLPVGAGPTPVENVDWQVAQNHCESLYEDAMSNIATVNPPY
jgi:hypothetical protein